MKINEDAPSVEDMLKVLAQGGEVRKVTGPGDDDLPLSPHELAEQQAHILEIIAEGGVRFLCIGCDMGIEPKDAVQCECGGFVCPACRRTEEEGVCNHERPAYLPEDDED
jgi:hypothetical protein